MTIGTINQTFHVTGNTSSAPVSISAINLNSSAGSDAFTYVNCTNVGTADAYTKWGIGVAIDMSMGIQGSTDRFLLCFGAGLGGTQLLSMGPVTNDWSFLSSSANFAYVTQDGPVSLQVENQKSDGTTTDAVLSALISGNYGAAYSQYTASDVGTWCSGINGLTNEYAIGTDRPGEADALTISGSTGAIKFNNAYTFPTSDGSADQVLTTDGAGNLSFQDGGGGGGITWNTVSGTSQSAAVNNGYITNNASLVTVTLPSSAAVGDVVRVAGKGAGGWKVAQNSGQVIHFDGVDTTTGTGGSLASQVRYDAVELLCITTDTDWLVVSGLANLSVV